MRVGRWSLALASAAVVVVAGSVSFPGLIPAQAAGPVLGPGNVRFIPVGHGTAIDDPIWANGHTLFVTAWRDYVGSLAKVDPSRGHFLPVPTLKLSGCGLSPERFATRKGKQTIAYLVDCFRPGALRSLNPVTEFGVFDLGSERNRRFGSISVPLGSTGRVTFSPDGTRAILDSGGLYSQLEWLAPHKLTPIRQGLPIAAAPTWSPDGRLVVFGGVPQPSGSADITTQPTNLYTFRPNEPQTLHLVLRGLQNFEPTGVGWMPASSRLLIANLQPTNQPAGLWLVDVTTGRKALLLKGPLFGRPAVSPNGRTVAVGVGVDAEYQPDNSHHVGLDLIRLPTLARLRNLLR
jgi:hypothetical protein